MCMLFPKYLHAFIHSTNRHSILKLGSNRQEKANTFKEWGLEYKRVRSIWVYLINKEMAEWTCDRYSCTRPYSQKNPCFGV